jgi:hypothetical protein
MAIEDPTTAMSSDPSNVDGMVIDLFARSTRPDEQLDPAYLALRDSPLLAPARNVIADLRCRIGDFSAYLAEDFQTTGFGSRLFQLLLIGMFNTTGHRVEISAQGRRLLLTKAGISASVDVLTAEDPVPRSNGLRFADAAQDEDRLDSHAHHRHGISTRLAAMLLQQLRLQRYAGPSANDMPFVLAVHDMRLTSGGVNAAHGLSNFLLGQGQRWRVDISGQFVVDDDVVNAEAAIDADAQRKLAGRVPAGLFAQPGAQDISAVLFFAEPELVSKFNRLGQEGAHRCDAVRMLRHGTCLVPKGPSNTFEAFAYEVGQNCSARESWSEGSVLIHNPHARLPLPHDWLGAGVEEALNSGAMTRTLSGSFHPSTSVTEMLPGDTPSWWIEQRAHLIAPITSR